MDLKFIKVEKSDLFFYLQRHAINELQAQCVFGILAKVLEKIITQEILSRDLFLKDTLYFINISNGQRSGYIETTI